MEGTHYSTVRANHIGSIGQRIKLTSLKSRSTLSSEPVLPPTSNAYKNSASSSPSTSPRDGSSRTIDDLLPKKRERKLFTSSRKKWRNVGRRFSSPFAGMLRTGRTNAKLKGTRGTLLLFHCDTKKRIQLAEKFENEGYNVEQHSIPDKAMGCLRTNSVIAGAIVAINNQMAHDTALEFLRLLDLTTDRLADISIALMPSIDDCQVIEAQAAMNGNSNGNGNGNGNRKRRSLNQLQHLRRGLSIQLLEARKCTHVRCELRSPSEEEAQVNSLLIRFEQMVQRESHASETFAKAKRFDFEHKKEYLKMKESKQYSSGHRVAGLMTGGPRKLKKKVFLAWKMAVKENQNRLKEEEKQIKKTVNKGMTRGRKQGLFKRLKTKAKAVSTSKKLWQQTITNSITQDRLIKRAILPAWLPLRMKKLYLAPDTSERDLLRAVEIFRRMVRRRSEVWPRACLALAYCRVSEISNTEQTNGWLHKAEQELTICINRKKQKNRADLYYNRSVVKLRQGKTVPALKDLAEIMSIYDNDKRHVDTNILEAALYNRQLIQRRFGNFILSFVDLDQLNQRRQAKNTLEKIERSENEQDRDQDDEKDEDNYEDDDDDRILDPAFRHAAEIMSPTLPESNNTHNLTRTRSFLNNNANKANKDNNNKHKSNRSQRKSILRIDDDPSSSSSSSDSSDTDEDDDERNTSGQLAITPNFRRRRGRRSSLMGTVGFKVQQTKKDNDDGQSHSLNLVQEFSDTQIEKHFINEKKKEETMIAPSYIDTIEMSKKEKEKRIQEGVKHMFNKTLPSNVYDALSVPIASRTRKHWKAIRFVTDTMAAFSGLPEALKNHLCKVLTLAHHNFNTYICRHGDEADNFYLIISGYLRVEVPNPADKKNFLVVNRMGPGVAFGELSLVFDQKRAASVITDSKRTTLIVIPKAQFKLLGLAQYHLAKLQDKYKTLCQSSIFDSWTDESLTALAQIAQVKTFKQNEQIIKQDSRPDHLHILRKGVVQVISRTDELGELRREEAALQLDLDRKRKKRLVSKLLQADKSVKESKLEEDGMQKRLIVVKKAIKKCVLLPKPKAQTNIATLFAPAFFGENSVVAPDRGERYTAVAETYCETLQIARPQIKSKWIGQTFVAALKRGMVIIPPGEELRALEKIRNEWAGKKSKVCEIIDTSRHPKFVGKE